MKALEERFSFQMGQVFGSADAAFEAVPAALWPYFLFPPDGQAFISPAGDTDAPVVEARVNHGAWQTCCPFCPSAQHASRTDRRFFCARCLNSAVGNKTITVTWPDDDTVAEIEEALEERPFVTSRNWEPFETVEALLEENAAQLTRADADDQPRDAPPSGDAPSE